MIRQFFIFRFNNRKIINNKKFFALLIKKYFIIKKKKHIFIVLCLRSNVMHVVEHITNKYTYTHTVM